MKKTYVEIKSADFSKVHFNEPTPHCVIHGAMNKLNVLEDGGGYWRCLSAVSKESSTVCRAGCCEKRII